KMKSACRRALLLTIFISVQLATAVEAYGPLGHEIVGGIADERLANTPTAMKVRTLLDGLTLEKAAVIADEIEGWDKKGEDDHEASCAHSARPLRRRHSSAAARRRGVLRCAGTSCRSRQRHIRPGR